jgi:hypothetical protein
MNWLKITCEEMKTMMKVILRILKVIYGLEDYFIGDTEVVERRRQIE